MSQEQDFYTLGVNLRRDMFGPAGAEEQINAATPFTAPMQDIVTRFCFGEIWHRPHLDRKTRSMLTIAIIATLSRNTQLKAHVQGALKNGVSKEEICEVLLHTMVYAGVPASVDSFNAAAEVFKTLGLE